MSGSLVEHILHARVNFCHGQKNSLCLKHEGKQAWLECRYTPKRSLIAVLKMLLSTDSLLQWTRPLWCWGSMRTSYARYHRGRTCSLDYLWMLISTKSWDCGYVQILINYTSYYVCKRKWVVTDNILSSQLFGFFWTGIENRSLCP